MLKVLWLLLVMPGMALANDWDALRVPGTFALMRHALAPGTSDPAGFQLNNCATQRNLDARGRDQARRTGAAFRDQGIAFEQVLTSQWCRTRETAKLLDLGPVTDTPALNSFFEDFSLRDGQTDAVMTLLRGLNGNALLVSHQVNITALTGQGTRSGEILVVRLTKDGTQVVGSILLEASSSGVTKSP
ncbi:MAG: histidine phosphatase family protein [Sedimentitalea sp.]